MDARRCMNVGSSQRPQIGMSVRSEAVPYTDPYARRRKRRNIEQIETDRASTWRLEPAPRRTPATA
jgi:hypothetical protein